MGLLAEGVFTSGKALIFRVFLKITEEISYLLFPFSSQYNLHTFFIIMAQLVVLGFPVSQRWHLNISVVFFNIDTERNMKYSKVVMNIPYCFLCSDCGKEER